MYLTSKSLRSDFDLFDFTSISAVLTWIHLCSPDHAREKDISPQAKREKEKTLTRDLPGIHAKQKRLAYMPSHMRLTCIAGIHYECTHNPNKSPKTANIMQETECSVTKPGKITKPNAIIKCVVFEPLRVVHIDCSSETP